jgi:mono/diheme cytochrome c family protein
MVNNMFQVWNRMVLLTAVALFVGCGKADPPQFKSNLFEMVQQETPADQQQVIANVLEAMFGTPDQPFVLPEAGLDLAKIKLAAGPVWSDQVGMQRGLYRQHCVHCHGITGDGIGPTAAILNPYPRDYRPGKYKYKSTVRAAMPTDVDLERILRQGVNGTGMPSFDLLAPSEIDALAEYVKYLSLRGQVESALIRAVAELGEGEKLPLDRATLVDDGNQQGTLIVEAMKWQQATESIVDPPAKPEIELAESIDKGRVLFYGAKANCVKCHGPTALGDGVTTDYDDWQKPFFEAKKVNDENLANIGEMKSDARAAETKAATLQRSLGFSMAERTEPLSEADAKQIIERCRAALADSGLDESEIEEVKTELAKEAPAPQVAEEVLTLLADKVRSAQTDAAQKAAAVARVYEMDAILAQQLPLRPIMPRNLRLGVYRFGRRPVDLFRRIHEGINGVPMPGGSATPGFTPDEMWNVVDYVHSLPYESINRVKPDPKIAGAGPY